MVIILPFQLKDGITAVEIEIVRNALQPKYCSVTKMNSETITHINVLAKMVGDSVRKHQEWNDVSTVRQDVITMEDIASAAKGPTTSSSSSSSSSATIPTTPTIATTPTDATTNVRIVLGAIMGDGAHLAQTGSTMSANGFYCIVTSESNKSEREEECGLCENLKLPRSLGSNAVRVGEGSVDGAGTIKNTYQGYPTKFTAQHIKDDLGRRAIPVSVKSTTKEKNADNKEKLKHEILGCICRSGFLPEADCVSFCRASKAFVVGDLMHSSGSHTKNCIRLLLNMFHEDERKKIRKWLTTRGAWKAHNRMIDWIIIQELLILLDSGQINEGERDYPFDVDFPAVCIDHLVVNMKLRALLMMKSPGATSLSHVLKIQLVLFIFDRTMYTFSEAAREWQIRGGKTTSRFGGSNAPSFEVFHGLYSSLIRSYRFVCRIAVVFDFDCSRYEALFIPLRNVTHYRTNYDLAMVMNAIESHRIASDVKKIINTLDSHNKNQTEHQIKKMFPLNPCPYWQIDDDGNEWILFPVEFVEHFTWHIIFVFTLADLNLDGWEYNDSHDSWDDVDDDQNFRPIKFNCGKDAVERLLQPMSIAHMNTRDVYLALHMFAQKFINNPVASCVPGARNFDVTWQLFQDQMVNFDDLETGKVLRKRLKQLNCTSVAGGGVCLPPRARLMVEKAKEQAQLDAVANQKRCAQQMEGGNRASGRQRKLSRKQAEATSE